MMTSQEIGWCVTKHQQTNGLITSLLKYKQSCNHCIYCFQGSVVFCFQF